MSKVYYTKCCDHAFIGKKKSPENIVGKCLICGRDYAGENDFVVLSEGEDDDDREAHTRAERT